ncbi:hypothetical protein FACS189468_5790 [Spirochaetia bacterium]|nr:hypothetical protein FACS189468_5790 [Spirochaetia bacterium]
MSPEATSNEPNFFCKALIDYLLDSESEYADELRTMEPGIIVKSMALHDVGKIGIPDRILLKPGKLDLDEFETMKNHTVVGRNIIEDMLRAVKDKDSIYLKHCHDICYGHHERFDGKGYPQGLKGYDIPLSARLASLSDVYDALVCARVYKAALSYGEAVNIIAAGRGTQFDPILADAVVTVQAEFRKISQQNR